MTVEYIETRAKDDSIVRIEVEFPVKPKTGFGPQMSGDEADAAAVTEAYDQTLSIIRACAGGIIDTLQGLTTPPSAASVDFALKIDAKAGAMIARSPGDAHFKVSLSWRQPEPEQKEEQS